MHNEGCVQMLRNRLISIGVDGSNLRAGGGVTHLCELIKAAEPERHGIGRVVLWAGSSLLEQVSPMRWLERVHVPVLDRSLTHRVWWQNVTLSRLARTQCDLLFVPGGNYAGRFRPFVTMSRNLLPFQPSERERYGRTSWMYTKLALLRRSQARTMRRADGVIFLTRYAHRTVVRVLPDLASDVRVIPHGVDERFWCEPRPQLPLSAYDAARPFKLVYVSTIDMYKHQWHVADAVGALRRRGVHVAVDFVGAAYSPALARLKETLARVDPGGRAIRYVGPVPYVELPALYRSADAFVFGSTCETMSNILLEAMASGLPVAASDYGLSHEVAGEAAWYFQPEQPASIERTLMALLEDPARRGVMAAAAHRRAREFAWATCAQATFGFLADVHARTAASSASRVSADV